MSNFTVSPATLVDLPGIAKISRAAFKESRHTMSYWMFPQDNEKAIYEWRLNGITNIFKNVSYCNYIKLVDTTVGMIVAFALWEVPHPPETEEEKTKREQEKKQKGDKDDKLPEGTKVQLLHDFEAETERVRSKYVDRERDYSEQNFPKVSESDKVDSICSSLESHCYSPSLPRQRLRIVAASVLAREDRRRRR